MVVLRYNIMATRMGFEPMRAKHNGLASEEDEVLQDVVTPDFSKTCED